MVNRPVEPEEPVRLVQVKIEDLTFNRETDSYGACSGEEKGKGLLCAGVNFSCGDIVEWSHDTITLQVPEGQGANKTMVLTIGGQSTTRLPAQ